MGVLSSAPARRRLTSPARRADTAGAYYPRHRHQEFLRLLKHAAAADPGVPLHLVLDNYGTRKRPAVRA